MRLKGGGINACSMFVKTSEADGIIEVFMEDLDTDRVIITGYFSADMDFEELMQSITNDGDGDWDDSDLTAYLDEDGRICDFLLTHNVQDAEQNLGVRTNNSALDRYIREHEAEAGGYTGFGISAKSDNSGIVELKSTTIDEYFVLTGYFKFEIVIVAPTVTTQAATGIGFD
ncbi:hypothetical protein ES703_74604 [subsurface metagenome]